MAAIKSPKEKKAKDASRAANASKVSADESSAKQDVAPVDSGEKEQLGVSLVTGMDSAWRPLFHVYSILIIV
jgi:hypothetical protein